VEFHFGTIDWNTVGGVATIFALWYAWRQLRQWHDQRDDFAAAIKPALRSGFLGCAASLRASAEKLRIAAKNDSISELPARARSFRCPDVVIIERFLDRLDCFGREEAPRLAKRACAVILVHAELEILASMRPAGGVLEPIAGKAFEIADMMDRAADKADAAADSLKTP
jgi:hypothetical protein